MAHIHLAVVTFDDDIAAKKAELTALETLVSNIHDDMMEIKLALAAEFDAQVIAIVNFTFGLISLLI